MKREITIQRNNIENMLMVIKDFIVAHRKAVLAAFAVIVVLTIGAVVGAIFYDKITAQEYYAYNNVMKAYTEDKKTGEPAAAEKAAGEILKLANKSRFGYVHQNGKFLAAGLFLTAKKYDLALKNYQEFADSSSSIMVPYAKLQAGICAEWLGNNDQALAIYTAMEKDYRKESIMDRIYYDLARMYQKKNDSKKAVEYFNKVKTLFPDSVYAQLAKKRMYTMSVTAE
jgi:tetratricopeptide (TPR) repeat protein